MKKLNTLIKGLTVFRKQLVLVLISLSIVFNLKAEDGSNTVVDIIVNSPDHTTLEAAVLAAELEGALSGEGPFTVFAPTDDAFAALPEGTVDALLNDIPALTAILTYHVAGGKVLSTDLSDGMVITTLNGKDVTVSITGEGVFINDAKVMVADIPADNGVVHVIDAVLIPPASTNVLNRVAAERMFKVYPNPAENYLNINLLDDYTGKPGTISIVRIDGTQIMEISTKDSIYNLDVSHLSSGIYFVLMKTGNKVYSEKLMIK